VSELRKALDVSRNERDRLQAELARVAAERARLEAAEATVRQLRTELDAVTQAPAVDETDVRTNDLDALERKLRERGHRVAELEARGRDAERALRELLAEIRRRDEAQTELRASGPTQAEPRPADHDVAEPSGEATPAAGTADDVAGARPGEQAPAVPDAPPAVAAVEPGSSERGAPPGFVRLDVAESLRQQLEVQAQRCSTHLADLEAARWTIAALRHELAQAGSGEQTSELEQLEGALRAAQLELAQLRSRLGERAPGAGEGR
jgi:hypothetical protein